MSHKHSFYLGGTVKEIPFSIISAIAGILLKSQDVYFFSVQFFARY